MRIRRRAPDTPTADDKIYEQIARAQREMTGFRRFLRAPGKVLRDRPLAVLYISIPLALAVAGAGCAILVQSGGWFALAGSALDDIVILAIFVAAAPLAVLDTIDSMRKQRLEAALPNFFRDLAGMYESGMTLPHAVHIVSDGDYGALSPHVRRLDREMSWNASFDDAMKRFGDRVGTPLVRRSVDLITRATAAGGNVGEVLNAAARDAYATASLAAERRTGMSIYVVIIIVAFLVFLFVIGVLTGSFLSAMAEAGSSLAGTGQSLSGLGGSVDMSVYKRLFTHAAVLQALFSGIVAGQMGEGRAVAGVKYSVMMMVTAWAVFAIAL